jgi:glycosyltransferase involved in cell wall biosynthesis
VSSSVPRRRATLVYRGQLTVEESRLRFLLRAACTVFDQVDVVMLSPGLGATEDRFRTFVAAQDNARALAFLRARPRDVGAVRGELGTLVLDDLGHVVVGVGFSVLPYLPARRSRVWCVNGIPEERLLHRRGWRHRAAARWAWTMARRARPSDALVVSEPMARLVADRTGARCVIVPNSVDRSVFTPDLTRQPTYLTYQGGASPWQGLHRLSAIWRALHDLDPSLRFRVISQDPRAEVLAERLPPDAVDRRSPTSPRAVAELLKDARAGFLVRAPDIVNEVAWPMKLGEYLAAGAPVVVSRCGWDAERLIEQHNAGLVVDWDDPPERAARAVHAYLRTIGTERPPGIATAADELDDERWVPVAAAAMAIASSGAAS